MSKKKLTIAEPAIKEKKNGKIHPAPSKAWSHDQVEAKEHIEDKNAKRGFVTSEGKFVGRKKAAKIAEKSGEVKDKSIKKLHSSDLRKSLGIKKKVLK
jgi:hypothetical protein